MTVEQKPDTVTSKKSKRRSLYQTILAVPAPSLNAVNPLLPNTTDRDDENQLHSVHQGQPLRVDIPSFDRPPPGGEDDGVEGIIHLLWDGSRTGDRFNFVLPIPEDVFPLTMTLGASFSANAGKHYLSYETRIGGNDNASDRLEINIDKMAPNNGNPGNLIILPAEVETGGITDEYLRANGEKVALTVPGGYSDARIGDVVKVYLGTTIPTAVLIDTFIRTDLGLPITVELTRGQIGSNEGEQTLFYTLEDRKGNIGALSLFKSVRITLTPAPADLRPPTVPAGDDGEINYAEAVAGVRVGIPPYTNWRAGDRVVVSFDGVEQPAQEMPDIGAQVLLPYSAVFNGDAGVKTSRVTYKIVRGISEHPEPTGYTTQVDLRTPGPVDPTDPPGEVHPLLNLPIVLGRGSQQPNKLTLADRDQDADATVEIYDDFKAGDVVKLYWNGVAVTGAKGEYRVLGNEPSDFKIPFVIPWADILAAGNSSELPVRYTVAHPAVNDNVITSDAQPVEVEIREITIPAPLFLRLDPDFKDWLNCQSIVNVSPQGWVAEVSVAGGEPQLAGQELTFTYQGWSDSAGSSAIPGNSHTLTFTPTTEQANNGFVVRVPYAPPLLTTENRWGSISYVATIDGFEITSQRHLVRVYMRLTGGVTCRLS